MFQLLKILMVFLLYASPSVAQIGGAKAVTDTQRLADKFHVYLLNDGQRLIAPYASIDSLLASFVVSDSVNIGTGDFIVAPTQNEARFGTGINVAIGLSSAPQRLTVLSDEAGDWATAIENNTATGLGLIIDLSAHSNSAYEAFRIDNSTAQIFAVEGDGTFSFGDVTNPEAVVGRGYFYSNVAESSYPNWYFHHEVTSGTDNQPVLKVHQDYASSSGNAIEGETDATAYAISAYRTASSIASPIVTRGASADNKNTALPIVYSKVFATSTSAPDTVRVDIHNDITSGLFVVEFYWASPVGTIIGNALISSSIATSGSNNRDYAILTSDKHTDWTSNLQFGVENNSTTNARLWFSNELGGSSIYAVFRRLSAW